MPTNSCHKSLAATVTPVALSAAPASGETANNNGVEIVYDLRGAKNCCKKPLVSGVK